MNPGSSPHDRDLELVYLYALRTLPPSEMRAVEAHVSTCANCRQELTTLRPIVDAFVSWPTDVLRPDGSLWERLTQRIATEAGQQSFVSTTERRAEMTWDEVAPGVLCKVFVVDAERERVSMLVRLSPGTDYPAHSHVGIEELYLLQGELMIDHETLLAGDYNRAEPGSTHCRVWSETGCTCLLLTSTRDALH